MSDLQPLTMSELDALSTVFFPHRVDIDLQLFSPVSKMANSFDCMSGYFSSGVLRELGAVAVKEGALIRDSDVGLS